MEEIVVSRALAILCILALLVVLLPAVGLAGANFEGYAFVNNPNPADRLNLRTQPNHNAQSIGKFYNGVIVRVEERDAAPGWSEVSIGSLRGYMQNRYLFFGEHTSTGVPSAMPAMTIVAPPNTNQVPYYEAASLNATILGTISAGQKTLVQGVLSNGWYCVMIHDGQASFMQAQHLSGEAAYAVVNNPNSADRLHLRVAPRTSAASLGKYYNGVQVDVLEYMANDWVKVRIGDTVGYMVGAFLAFGDDRLNVRSAIPVMTVSNPNPADRLNLRRTASDKSESLGKYYNGTMVEVLGIGTVWYHVRIGENQIGYMMAKYLQTTGNM